MDAVNVFKTRLLPIKNRDVTRVNHAMLCSSKLLNVSVVSWQSGIAKDNVSDILFCIPLESLSFEGSNEFLKTLKTFWIQSGFKIVEENEQVSYISRDNMFYSRVFRLRSIA